VIIARKTIPTKAPIFYANVSFLVLFAILMYKRLST